MILAGQLFWTFAVLSVLSVGGAGAAIPEIHRQVVDLRHWMDEATFASLIAIAQTAPGPNVLIVSVIGWYLGGIPGLLIATTAILLPSSLLALGLGRLSRRLTSDTAVASVRRALAPIAIGLILASGYVMGRAAYHGILTVAIVGAVTALVYLTPVSPMWGIFAGAVTGMVGHRLHLFG